MNTSYFHGCTNPDKLKEKYRELALKFHPDRGGDVSIMQAINSLYHDLLKSMNGSKFFSKAQNGEQYERTFQYDENLEKEVQERLYQIIGMGFPDVSIYLIGSWIWLVGEGTKAVKSQLKEMGYKLAPKKKSWYWHDGQWKRRGKYVDTSLSDLANRHGYQKYQSELQNKISH